MPWSRGCLQSWGQFLVLAIPSMLMMFEWIASEARPAPLPPGAGCLARCSRLLSGVQLADALARGSQVAVMLAGLLPDPERSLSAMAVYQVPAHAPALAGWRWCTWAAFRASACPSQCYT